MLCEKWKMTHRQPVQLTPKSIIMIRDMTEEELLESGRRIGNLLKHYQTVALWNLAGPLANGVLVQTTSAAVGDNSAPSDQNSNLFASTSATTESDTAAMSTTAPPESSSGSGSKTGNSSSSSRSCCPSLFWKTTAAAVDPDDNDNDNDDDDGLVRISRRQRRKRTIHYQQQEQQYNDKQNNNNNENKFNNNLIINNNNNGSSSSSSKKRKSKSIYSRHSMGGVNIGDNDNNNNNNDRPPALPVLAARDSGAPMLCQQTLFEGESVACFVVGGERRLCFTQLLHSASFRQFSFADISRACAFLHIQCPPTSREQLDTLKLLGILPVSSTSCGLVTKSDATRLHSFLRIQSRASMLAKQRREAERGGIDGMYHHHHQQQQDQEQLVHGENLKNGGAKPAWLVVEHECFGGCRGRYYVHLYSTPAAECIECCDCGDLLSPETFVSHSHRNYERCVCHWGFDSANWRVYIHLPFDQDDTFYLHLLEQFKGRFEARSRHHDSTTLKRPLTDGTLSEERAKRRRCDAPEKMATFDKCSNLIHQHQQHLHHHQQQQQQHHHQHHHHLHHHQQQQQLPIIDPALCHAYASMLYAERNLLRAQAVGGPLATASLAKPEYGGALDLSSASIFPQIPAAPLDLSIRFANNCPLPIVRDCDVQSTSLAKNIQMENDERMLKSLRMNRPETSDCTGVTGVEQLLNMDAKCMPGPTAQMQAKHPLLNKGLQSTGNESIDALLKKYISDPVGLQEIQSKLFECFKDAEMKMCSLSLQNRVLLQELLQAENRRQLVAQNLLPISTLLTKSFF